MFAKAMRGFGDINGKTMLTEGLILFLSCDVSFLTNINWSVAVVVYPWGSLSKSTTVSVCDIGGGTGHVVLALLKSFPEHKFKAIVQDLPGMLAQGQKVCYYVLICGENVFLTVE